MTCNKKSDKYVQNPKMYVCNPSSNRWVLRSSPLGKKIVAPEAVVVPPKKNPVLLPPKPVAVSYKTIKPMGKSSFGETLLIELDDGKKLVLKKSLTKDKKIITKQYDILKKVKEIGSEYFVKPVFLAKNGCEFAMEYADLFIPMNEFFLSPGVPDTMRLKIGNNLIKAVRLLHKNKIAHRDIKPANIMVNPKDGRVKLIDFGISCTEKQCIKENSAGTFIYMPPVMLNNYDTTFKYYTDKLPYKVYKLYDEWALGLVLLTLSDKNFQNIVFTRVGKSPKILRDFYKAKTIYEPVLKEAQQSIDRLFKYKIFNKKKGC